MSRHAVTVDVPRRPLARADITFRVKADGKVFGTLAVSNGSVVWFPRNSTYGRKMGWKKFDQMMQNEPTRFERRK